MEITDIQIKLVEKTQERLLAFCSITFDRAFIVRDLKIIEGDNGLFVAMPNRKRSQRCLYCQHKNSISSNYCSYCGKKINNSSSENTFKHDKIFTDVAHPINPECREMIQNVVLEAYEAEKIKSEQPGYISSYENSD